MTWLSRPRHEPYTDVGIRRCKCVRCGAPSVHQWNVCADGNAYRALCLDCDIALNLLVLKWANDPNAEIKVAAYEHKQRSVP